MLTTAARVRPGRTARGFTLVELMIGIAVLAILIMAAAPSVQGWIISTRVRTAAEALQNGLRFAQAEAARQNRQVVFSRVSGAPGQDAVTDANGMNWSAQIVRLAGLDDDPARTLPDGTLAGARQVFIRGGPMADVASGVQVAGSANSQAICFSSTGFLVANPSPAPAATGASCAGGPVIYTLSHQAGDRRLTVSVSVNGSVRMCDPDKPRATNPDGCT